MSEQPTAGQLADALEEPCPSCQEAMECDGTSEACDCDLRVQAATMLRDDKRPLGAFLIIEEQRGEIERLRAENVRIEQQLIAAHEKIEQLRSAIRERLGYPGEHIPCGCVACKELEALSDE